MASRTLHVRCGTWDQVELFTTRKLRKGRILSMKVPFTVKVGAAVVIGLELPNEVVIAIDGTVQKASPVEVDGTIDPGRMWIEVDLIGFTDEMKARLHTLVVRAGDDRAPTPEVRASAPLRQPTASIADDLPADERELFQHLSNELRRLRQAAVHDVLGVSKDADADELRRSWKELIRRHHPDLSARRGAAAITHLAEELTILANRAYERMRAQLVVDGRATIVGPTLSSPPGWLVAFEDIPSGENSARGSGPKRAPRFERDGANPPIDAASPPPALTAASGQGSDAYEHRARMMLAQGDANTAREVLAAALVVYPRSKPLRSLYYVATAVAALHDGELMLATSQLETALAHHEQCVEASKMLEHIRKHGSQRAEEMRRFFR